jgi:hypothetical protein
MREFPYSPEVRACRQGLYQAFAEGDADAVVFWRRLLCSAYVSEENAPKDSVSVHMRVL